MVLDLLILHSLICSASFESQDNLARSKFYRGLPAVLKKLPKRVCLQRVLFCLANELTHKEMVPFILPNILLIGE